jgi:ketosteroid isomerase-like protein
VIYRAIVARQVRRTFELVGRGEYEAALSGVADDVTHTFEGDHPLGGTRHSREGMRRWFERVYELFPGLQFEIHEVVVKGWPWNTVAVVQWTDTAQPRDGSPYVNDGVHVLRIRWAKVVEIHAYLDTQKIRDACERMAAAGIPEADAAPIEA